MAVNVGQRNVPETLANTQCYAVDAVLTLCLHTVKITSNTNVFDVTYEHIVMLIQDYIIDAYISAYTGNKIRVHNEKTWRDRSKLQHKSLDECLSVLGLINVSHRLFHLPGKKVAYWTTLAQKAIGLLRKWIAADEQRYNEFD